MKDFRAVLFDFDGVIAHTLGIVKHSLIQLFQKNNLPLDEDEFESWKWGTKSLVQLSAILKEKYSIELDPPAIHAHIWETQKALFEAWLESDPSLIPFLEYCKNCDKKIAIGSNSGTSRIEWVVQLLQLEKYFLKNPLLEGGEKNQNEERGIYWKTNPPPSLDSGTSFKKEVEYTIIGANMLTNHKPDPEVWLKCAEMLETPITDCLVIEDGLPGLTGASQCGARGIYYHRFCRPEKACIELAERSVESFEELLK